MHDPWTAITAMIAIATFLGGLVFGFNRLIVRLARIEDRVTGINANCEESIAIKKEMGKRIEDHEHRIITLEIHAEI